jgi:quercetin dioxygenase-like cupin family protein
MPTTATPTQLRFLNTLVTVWVSSDEGEDGLSLIEHVAPHGDSPPLHIHHTEDELIYFLEGEFRFQLDEEELRLGAGASLLAPKGVPHTYRVESERGRWLVATTHGDFESLVRLFSQPIDGRELLEPAPPTPEQAEALAAAAREHGIEVVGGPIH